jgi:hypothetical protein
MKVNLLSYEAKGGWILYDYAEKLQYALKAHGTEVNILQSQHEGYDVTFHINYWGLRKISSPGLHCTMVTHIDTADKFRLICSQASAGVYGICMSEDTARKLRELSGFSTFLGLPPPAMSVPANPKKINIMIAARLYADGRKNERLVVEFLAYFSPIEVEILIIGAGWADIVSTIRLRGFKVIYFEEFERSKYVEALSGADYLLVTGHDEGAISTLDAIAHGVTPICTAQGFHLELGDGVLLFQTESELFAIARMVKSKIQREFAPRTKLSDWNGFASRHLNFWREILSATLG